MFTNVSSKEKCHEHFQYICRDGCTCLSSDGVYVQQTEIPARGPIPFAAFDQDGNAPQEKGDLI